MDLHLCIAAASTDFARRFGRSTADVCGRDLYDLLHPGSGAVLDRHFAVLAEGRDTVFAEHVLGQGPERLFAAELTGIAVKCGADELSAFIVLVEPEEVAVPVVLPSAATLRRRPLLTPLDATILEGVAAGASTVQLATRVYLSRQGVEYHVGTMLRKLRAANRAALVARAYSMGLLVAGSWPPQVVRDFVGN